MRDWVESVFWAAVLGMLLAALVALVAQGEYTNAAGGVLYVKERGTVTISSGMVAGSNALDRVRVAFDTRIVLTNLGTNVVVEATRSQEYGLLEALGTNLYTNVVAKLLQEPTP